LDGDLAWNQIGADFDGEAAGDFSGNSVSLSADGTTVAIGAPYSGGTSTNRGQVRVYTFNTNSITSWTGGRKIEGYAALQEFGWSVSLSADGTTVAIGAIRCCGNGSNKEKGYVRVYKKFAEDLFRWDQIGTNPDTRSLFLRMEKRLPLEHGSMIAPAIMLVMYASTSWMVTRCGIRLEQTLTEWLVVISSDTRSLFLPMERRLPLEHPPMI
jgi:hypothetical protein